MKKILLLITLLVSLVCANADTTFAQKIDLGIRNGNIGVWVGGQGQNYGRNGSSCRSPYNRNRQRTYGYQRCPQPVQVYVRDECFCGYREVYDYHCNRYVRVPNYKPCYRWVWAYWDNYSRCYYYTNSRGERVRYYSNGYDDRDYRNRNYNDRNYRNYNNYDDRNYSNYGDD